jgi:hypothetical protein
MKNQRGVTLIELIMLFAIIFGAIGWTWNVIKIIAVANAPIADVTVMLVIRIVAVFVWPIGCIVGYL